MKYHRGESSTEYFQDLQDIWLPSSLQLSTDQRMDKEAIQGQRKDKMYKPTYIGSGVSPVPTSETGKPHDSHRSPEKVHKGVLTQ